MIEKRIRLILNRKGLKMSDLANRVGMGQSNLVASIRNNPKLSTLEDICVALGIELSDIIGTREEKSDGILIIDGKTYAISKPKTRTIQLRTYNDYQELRNDIKDFIKKSLKTKELGSIGGMVEDFEYFTLIYDYNSEDSTTFENFYVSIQYGKGNIWTNSYDTFEYVGENDDTDTKMLISDIINDIEGKVLMTMGLEYKYLTTEE